MNTLHPQNKAIDDIFKSRPKDINASQQTLWNYIFELEAELGGHNNGNQFNKNFGLETTQQIEDNLRS